MPRSELHGAEAPRLLIVPGLNDSGPAHWQSWLQARERGALRVKQRDWVTPDLERWAERVAHTAAAAGSAGCIAVAHSFGCLALVRHLQREPQANIVAALLVAPADPDRFGLGALLGPRRIGVPSTVVVSDTDPWFAAPKAQRWAFGWGSHVVNLGAAGHINTQAGFGPFPFAERWLRTVLQREAARRRSAHAIDGAWRFAC